MKDFKNESNNFQQFQLNATQFSGRDAWQPAFKHSEPIGRVPYIQDTLSSSNCVSATPLSQHISALTNFFVPYV